MIDNTYNNNSNLHKNARADHVSFWANQAKNNLSWFTPWSKTLDWQLPFARWFVDGEINASYNALDVHTNDKTAIIWEGEDGTSQTILYSELLVSVKKFANVLLSLDVKKGDRVTLYLPMIPELVVAMLACARIGATHNVIFSGFSAPSVRDRIVDCQSKIVITADVGFRRKKIIELKSIIDKAIDRLDFVKHVVVLYRTDANVTTTSAKDVSWHDLIKDASDVCDAIPVESNHPLFILYTSGTTGKPKGVLHGTGGYLTHVTSTFKWAFGILDSDVFFCTADIGWVTGHSYVVYAPLIHGATIVMYEGAPDYPDISQTWKMIEKYGITILYTAPTLLRMLMGAGNDVPESFNLSSLRLLGSVGEPINPEVWRWYHDIIGKSRCPVIDTWWQTETGGIMISALPGIQTIPLKPGSGTFPIPGVNMDVVDKDGTPVEANTKGYLIIRDPWPGMLLTLWENDEKYNKSYWSRYRNCYYSGDYAKKDSDGYLWLLGRADDVINVAGHRIGTAEIESCLVEHSDVAESAVCSVPDDLRGEEIRAFVVPRSEFSDEFSLLRDDLLQKVRDDISSIAVPSKIYFVSKLPKTRSGKIMRRLIKSIVSKSPIGDLSTLDDRSAVTEMQNAVDLDHK